MAIHNNRQPILQRIDIRETTSNSNSKKHRKVLCHSERLVLVVALTIVAMAVMTVLEVVHVVFLGVWNSEVFSAITSLAGLVVGTLIGARA